MIESLGLFLLILGVIVFVQKKQGKNLLKIKKSSLLSSKAIENSVKISYLTTAEARKRSKELRDSPNCVFSTILLPEGAPERFRDPEVLFDELEAIEVLEEYLNQIQEEIASSQQNSLGRGKMIPLCVAFADRQKVKDMGARWCLETKTWFWSFTEERLSVEAWLPYIYRPKYNPPYISSSLVPKNLWGINLRSLLHQEEWDKIRKDTYKRYAYRCAVCGCKGPTWPVECDELWAYNADQQKPWRGTVVFSGLLALCPGCHQIKHFGKACVDGEEELTVARMCFLNEWNERQAYQQVNEAFLLWEERSKMEWKFDFTLLKELYEIDLHFESVESINTKKNSSFN
jgi:hypothetical protein